MRFMTSYSTYTMVLEDVLKFYTVHIALELLKEESNPGKTEVPGVSGRIFCLKTGWAY